MTHLQFTNNYTCAPALSRHIHFLNRPYSLSERLNKVPVIARDRLHPSKAQPYAEYVEQGLWKTRVAYQKDASPLTATFIRKAKGAEKAKTLDEICEDELRRRFPKYCAITGMKASFKDRFPLLSRWVMGKERYFEQLTKKEIARFKKQISFSACDRDDLISQPQVQDALLREELNLKDDSILRTEHIFAKNSPLNGQCFIRDGKTIHLSQGIACTSDRTVENTGNLRLIQTKDKESLCYTGRPDTDRKALEQASFIFFNELKTTKKGITEIKDAEGNTVYQLDYVVNSLLSATWLWSKESPISTFPEREFLENEILSFNNLKNQGYIRLENPNAPGTFIKVQFNPILFSQSLNAFNRLEKWLPPFVTGESRSKEISEESLRTLFSVAENRIAQLEARLTLNTPSHKRRHIEKTIASIKSALNQLSHPGTPLQSEEEILIRDYLCKLLRLPVVYHCKSSLDRTSIPIAISSVLHQWKALNLRTPKNLRDLIKDRRFKELFMMNLLAGHQVTRYTCNRKGTVAGEKLKTKTLGFTFHRGIFQNNSIIHLVPERYLKDFPLAEKIKWAALILLLAIPFLLALPLVIASAVRLLAYCLSSKKNPHWVGPLKFAFPILLFTLIFKLPEIFPDKVLNEDSPQIGARHLIARDLKH